MPPRRELEERRSRRTNTSRRPAPSTLGEMRQGIGHMFTRRPRVVPAPESVESGDQLESPKTPRLVLGLQNFSSTRLAIPYLNRNSTSLPSTPMAADAPSPLSPRPI